MNYTKFLVSTACIVGTALPAVAQNSGTTWTWGQKPASTSSSQTSTGASSGSSRIKKAPPRIPTRPYTRDPSNFQYKAIDKAPDLPDLPSYSGHASVIDVVVAPNAFGNTVYNVTSSCKDPVNIVHDWYAQALKGNGWKMNGASTGSAYLAGTKDKNEVRISINTAPDPKDGCEIIITYVQGGDQRR